MPQDIVEDENVWTLTVQVAADGDPVDGASQVLIGQDLADRTAYLRKRTLGPVGGIASYPTPLADYGQNSGFSPIGPAVNFTWYQANNLATDIFAAPLWLPFSGRVTKVYATVNGNGAGGGPHVGWPLGAPPVIRLYKHDALLSVNRTLLASASDPSGSAAAYDTWHELALTGLAIDLAAAQTYFIEIQGESGANSIAGAFALTSLIAEVEPAP
jgi:hypothetical protein